MIRMGRVIGLKADRIAEYKKLHAETWPEIRATIGACNIRNYSIFLREPENLLFAYWEYVGADFEADVARMAGDPVTQRWWKLTSPMQEPLETRAKGEWWSDMEHVFFNE